MYIRYSLAMCAGGLVTGLAYYHQSKQRPFLITAQPQPAKIKDITAELWDTTKLFIHNKCPRLVPVIQHGIPSYGGLQIRETYLLSYSRKNKVPNWVMEHLTKDMLEGEAKRDNIYKIDTAIPQNFRSTKEDYKSSGFDKGHLAKAENYKSSQKAMDETFFMSNMAPQDPRFNRYELWRVLENHVLNLVKQRYGKYKSVFVCSGPLYLPRELTDEQEAILLGEKENWELTDEQEAILLGEKENWGKNNDVNQKNYIIYKVIGENNVAVPTHFFKVLLCEVEDNSYDMEAYVIQNKSNNPKNSKTSEDMVLKEGNPNKPNDPKQSKTSEGRSLKEVIPNKSHDPKKSKTLEDSRLKKYLVPKDAIEEAAGFIIFPELKQSKIRRIKLKESASPEYYNN